METWRCPECSFEFEMPAKQSWSFFGFQASSTEFVSVKSCPRCLFEKLRELVPEMVRVGPPGVPDA